jgi:hypothetical protein
VSDKARGIEQSEDKYSLPSHLEEEMYEQLILMNKTMRAMQDMLKDVLPSEKLVNSK